MRLLLTNDDGINAPGLVALETIAREIAGPEGDIWIAAPAFEQSGVAHKISFTHPFTVSQFGPQRFAAEGSPADCVIAGLHDVMGDLRPDLVLSGVNRGNNSGENALYSGTLGGAMEAALQGIPAVALSQYFGPRNAALDDPFDSATIHGAAVLRKLIDAAPWDADTDYPLFYNVNFPPCPAAETLPARIGPQGFRQGVGFGVTPHNAPNGRRFLWINGGAQDAPARPEGCDVALNMADHIAITPMRADLTAHDRLADLARVFAG